MSELKPCPKCDSDSISITSSRSMEISTILCGDCGHSMQRPICEDELEILWNASYAAEAQSTQPEATNPAQDLSAAILALCRDISPHKFKSANDFNFYEAGFIEARSAAAALASPADALVAMNREKALAALLMRIDDAFEAYERYGAICEFEGNPMIYADTLTEIVALRGEYHAIQAQKDGHG